MAIEILGTTVIDDSKNIQNVGIVSSSGNPFTLYRPILSDYSEKINNIGNTNSSCNIDLSLGNYVIATLNQSTTFSFSAGTTTGISGFALQLTNGSGGPFTITWPASIRWSAESIPARTTDDGKTDIWSFITTDGGTTWLGNLSSVAFAL